ncbi:MAG: phage-shock protein [Thermodesulfobacteriota bacterium]
MIMAIIFGGAILALAIIGSTIVMIVKVLKGGFSPRSRKFEAEETRMIQEMYQGLSRMEQRVEALETILLDRERKEQ